MKIPKLFYNWRLSKVEGAIEKYERRFDRISDEMAKSREEGKEDEYESLYSKKFSSVKILGILRSRQERLESRLKEA